MIDVFLTGQKSFGAAALKALCGHSLANVVGVAAPGAGEDRLRHEAAQRGLVWVPSEAFQAEQVPKCDLIVAAHSHAYLSRKARGRAKYGAVGYHPSLLPRHRGRDAVRWTIHCRDPIAGGTVYYFTDNVDAGPIINQAWCHVDPRWTATELWRERLFPMGVELIEQTVREFHEGGLLDWTLQDEAVATWEPSWERPPLYRPDLLELTCPVNSQTTNNGQTGEGARHASPSGGYKLEPPEGSGCSRIMDESAPAAGRTRASSSALTT